MSNQETYEVVRRLFKNDYGRPFEMTPGQIQIFRAVYEKQSPRAQVECYTQYGKSDVISMAVLLRATTFPEKWPILGGTKDKAKIIMEKVIKHIFDNEYTLGKFKIGKDESLERIKRERSKERLTFKVDDEGNMGEILILSAEARKKGDDAGNILIGYGAPNLIEDDAALIPDRIHGKAMRMVGGHKDNFVLKITNTFNRNHAYRSSNNPVYQKIKIDYKQGIQEGRITPEYIEEMREELADPVLFGILYECVYPPEDMIQEGKWMTLLWEKDIEEAQARKVQSAGRKRFGGDVAEGGDYNAFVIRTDNYAFVKDKNLEKDLMKTADNIHLILQQEGIRDEFAGVDAVGDGAGVVSRLHQMERNVIGIKSGEKPTEKTEIEDKLDPIEFSNLRAEMFWKARQWVRRGGALEPHKDWIQLTKILYKIEGEKKVSIMSKEEMRIRGIISPDIADAFAFTFYPLEKKQQQGASFKGYDLSKFRKR